MPLPAALRRKIRTLLVAFFVLAPSAAFGAPPACPCWGDGGPFRQANFCTAPGPTRSGYSSQGPIFAQVVSRGGSSYCRSNSSFRWTNLPQYESCRSSLHLACSGPLAVAYIDRNRNNSFDPYDGLIAMLVDMDANGAANAGDALVVDEYPLAFGSNPPAGSFATKVLSCASASAGGSSAFCVTSSGSLFLFDSGPGSEEAFVEIALATGGVSTWIHDRSALDSIQIEASSLLSPSTSLSTEVVRSGDQDFIDVSVFAGPAGAGLVDHVVIIGDVNAVGLSSGAHVPVWHPDAEAWHGGSWRTVGDPLHATDPALPAASDASPWPTLANAWDPGRKLRLIAAADSGSKMTGPGSWDPDSTTSRYSRLVSDVNASGVQPGDIDTILFSGGNNDAGSASYREYHDALDRLVDRIANDFPNARVMIAPLTSKAHAATDMGWIAISRAQWDVIEENANAILGPSQDDGLPYEADGETIQDVVEMGRRWAEAVKGQMFGRVYYVDPRGSDSDSGLSPAQAWAPPLGKDDKANRVPVAGDTVVFLGDQPAYDAHIRPQNSGVQGAPIRYVGQGAIRPAIRGAGSPGARWCYRARRGAPSRWIEIRGIDCEKEEDSLAHFLIFGATEPAPVQFWRISDLEMRGGNGGPVADPVQLVRAPGQRVDHIYLVDVTIDPEPFDDTLTDTIDMVGDDLGRFLLKDVRVTDGGHNSLYLHGSNHYVLGGSFLSNSSHAMDNAGNTGAGHVYDGLTVETTVPAVAAWQMNDLRESIVRRVVAKGPPGSLAPLQPKTNNVAGGEDSYNRYAHNTSHGGGFVPSHGALHIEINSSGPLIADGSHDALNNILVSRSETSVPVSFSFPRSCGTFCGDPGLGFRTGNPASLLRGNVLWNGSADTEVVYVHYDARDADGDEYFRLDEAEATFDGISENVNADPEFCNEVDYEIADSSPARDAGVWLTTVASSLGDELVVEDSRWFADAFDPEFSMPMDTVRGDTLVFSSGPETYRVIAVDHATNTLKLDTAPNPTPAVGTGVAYPYSGTAPDAGAREWLAPTCVGSGS